MILYFSKIKIFSYLYTKMTNIDIEKGEHKCTIKMN